MTDQIIMVGVAGCALSCWGMCGLTRGAERKIWGVFGLYTSGLLFWILVLSGPGGFTP